METQDLQTYGNLTVGDRVEVPGHRRKDPATIGTLTRIYCMRFARGAGYFAEVTDDSGNLVRTAVGLVWKVQ